MSVRPPGLAEALGDPVSENPLPSFICRLPVCVSAAQSCGPPPRVQNAQVQTGGETDRDGVSYVCDAGLQPVGSKTIFCLADGTWSLPTPACECMKCSDAASLPLASVKSLSQSAGPAAGGCDAPKQVVHGRVQEHDLSTGRAVEVQCDKGYDLVGEPLVVCIGGSAWSAAFPTCQRERRRLQERKGRFQNENGFTQLPVLCSQALPASPRLEGRGRRRRRRAGLPGGLPRRTVGPGHLSSGSRGQRQRHHHLQAGPDLEPDQLRLPK